MRRGTSILAPTRRHGALRGNTSTKAGIRRRQQMRQGRPRGPRRTAAASASLLWRSNRAGAGCLLLGSVAARLQASFPCGLFSCSLHSLLPLPLRLVLRDLVSIERQVQKSLLRHDGGRPLRRGLGPAVKRSPALLVPDRQAGPRGRVDTAVLRQPRQAGQQRLLACFPWACGQKLTAQSTSPLEPQAISWTLQWSTKPRRRGHRRSLPKPVYVRAGASTPL
mmetsp:Transcript_40039/g.87421  ORF Transcript_40039/g.87421 Transcript_40039/m.87421 type:complete len:222 (+) Transcript_40039:559-1224(+)